MKDKLMKQVLIDMPFSLPESPAFGLSQIKSYLAQEMPMEVETSILYLCHDFYQYFGEDIYKLVNKDFYKFYKFDENKYLWVDDLRKSGLEVEYFGGSLGDWIFRQEAFPEAKDNAEQYFSKYYVGQNNLVEQILSKRESLHEQLIKYLIQYHLDEYDIVGFTCRFQQMAPALSMARLIKERSPNCIIVMGGPSLEPPAGASIANMLHPVDYVLSGRRFLIGYKELLRSLIKRDTRTALSIPGVFSKEKNGSISGVDLYEASAEDDINTLLKIDYDDYFQSVKQKLGDDNKHRVVFLETS